MHALLEKKNIPKTPGCYLFKDEKEQIIYVGKSKFLPKRVQSYFQKKHQDFKTQSLVEQIRDIDFIITESEQEALIVEENLIKLYQPKFNIRGKDDKTVCQNLIILEEYFPRIELERGTEASSHGFCLAQFTSGLCAREVYNLLHEIFPLRSCSYNLNPENIELSKFKPCLEFQLGNCLAPCVGGVKSAIYNKMISDIKEIFKFNFKPTHLSLTRQRNKSSMELNFENAAQYQSKIKSLELLQKKVEPLRLNLNKQQLDEIGKFLNLKSTPLIIESFDNSHTNGMDGVACSVRFVMGMPQKSSYRKFIIKTAKVGDDYASFEEVLSRRFTRIISEKTQLPNLVIMDGGKAQLSVARNILGKLGVEIDIIGVSKDQKHRAKWIHLLNGETIDLMTVPNHQIIGKISEEVHRFAIKFHKQRRDKI